MRSDSMVLVLAFLLALLPASSALALEAPAWLPKYDVAINLDVDGHKAHVTQHVTWQNRHQRPASEIVFCSSSD